MIGESHPVVYAASCSPACVRVIHGIRQTEPSGYGSIDYHNSMSFTYYSNDFTLGIPVACGAVCPDASVRFQWRD